MKAANQLDLAIAHDYLIQMGGAERVVALMAQAFPEAPIYTSRTEYQGLLEEFKHSRIVNSWMQRVPISSKHFKKLFFFYPFAFYAHRASTSRILWISASTFAKCMPVSKKSISICYCHAPTRFLWQTDAYLYTEIPNRFIRIGVKAMLPFLRYLDKRAAKKVDFLVANSENIRAQIKQHYDRDADVIYPPVNVEKFKVTRSDKGYYLIVSRLVGYKGIDRAVRAFSLLDRELRIVGDGTDRKRLEKMAGSNVKFLGRVSDEEVIEQMENCRAFIFPGYEDFGITPVEAQACGKPVIAFGFGGALETVVDGKTGVHFSEGSPDALRDALRRLESITWDPMLIRQHAERFSEERFIREMSTYMQERA